MDIVYAVGFGKASSTVTLVPHDPGSRYKTKQLQVQYSGKTKMMKTILPNVNEVAKCMQLPHAFYLIAYIGYELNSTFHWYEHKPSMISGHHSPEVLSTTIQEFVEEFLLCKECRLPELTIKVKHKKVWGKCRGCPSFGELVLKNDKFQRYIVNHPPIVRAYVPDVVPYTSLNLIDVDSLKGVDVDDDLEKEEVEVDGSSTSSTSSTEELKDPQITLLDSLSVGPALSGVLQNLYQREIVSETTFEKWRPKGQVLAPLFYEWLDKAEEE